MTYELAKKLWDSNFPFIPVKEYDCKECGGYKHGDSKWIKHTEDCKSRYPFPSLSELIEACGDRFKVLTRVLKGTNGEAVCWYASDKLYDDISGHWGETPEEAVEKLWLALRESKSTGWKEQLADLIDLECDECTGSNHEAKCHGNEILNFVETLLATEKKKERERMVEIIKKLGADDAEKLKISQDNAYSGTYEILGKGFEKAINELLELIKSLPHD